MIPRDVQQIAALAIVAAAAIGLVVRFFSARRRGQACSSCVLRSGPRESANPEPTASLSGSPPEDS